MFYEWRLPAILHGPKMGYKMRILWSNLVSPIFIMSYFKVI